MNSPHPSSRWNPWPVSIITFFAIALLGCGSFIAFCNRHPADLVAADYYEQEVRYQRQMDQLQNAQAQGAGASVAFDAAHTCIRISFPANDPSEPRSGSIQLYRPSAIGLDREYKLATDAQGVQVIDASDLAPGLWKARVSWKVGSQSFLIDQKIVVRKS